MSVLQSLLVFIGIPVAFAIVVFVLVSASSWTRSGRTDADFEDDPLMIASDAAVPDPSRVPREGGTSPVAGGGVSARW